MSKLNEQQAGIPSFLRSEKNIDWINIIKQCKASGMAQAAYCKENEINYNQFLYQKSKLSVREKASSKLLPVQITPPERPAVVQNNFILHYPNGLKLHIPVNAHPEAIKTLINCLEIRQC